MVAAELLRFHQEVVLRGGHVDGHAGFLGEHGEDAVHQAAPYLAQIDVRLHVGGLRRGVHEKQSAGGGVADPHDGRAFGEKHLVSKGERHIFHSFLSF